jgi:hypothetical protein
MYKLFLLCLFCIVGAASLSAGCSQVPEAIRKSYSTKFYQAFIAQSQGKSTSAFCKFEIAYKEAKQGGENVLKLMALEQLFGWYRMYGSASGLFAKQPEGYDQILGEYRRPIPRSLSSQYYSEWGNTPEQAALIREFMMGVAETISGIFCVTVGAGITGPIGAGLCVDGTRRIILTLSNVWATHERAMIDLRKWEATVQKSVNVD